MKKIYLAKVQQYNEISYTGSVDPRTLVRMADQTIEIGQVQEDQRPLDKKHIQEELLFHQELLIQFFISFQHRILPGSMYQ